MPLELNYKKASDFTVARGGIAARTAAGGKSIKRGNPFMNRKSFSKITAWTLTLTLLLALAPALTQTAYAADITIDLDEITANSADGTGYTVNTSTNVITVSGTEPVIIKGDGRNGGDGWTIIIENTTDITIENNTTIFSTSGTDGALTVPPGATITGEGSGITIKGDKYGIYANGNVTIDGIVGSIASGEVFQGCGIYAKVDVTIDGTVGNITSGGRNGYGIGALGAVTIDGTVGNITASMDAGYGINAGTSVTIGGSVGNITGNSGINSNNNVTIKGDVGYINVNEGSSINAAGGSLIINGTVGNVTGSIGAQDDVNISGTVGNITVDMDFGIVVNGDVIITGTVGNITATGYDSIGIWGGNVTISGKVGNITGGDAGIVVDDKFTVSNNSVVYASSISSYDYDEWEFIPTAPDPASQGILFIGGAGTVYGNVTLGDNLTVNSDQTLTVPPGAILTVPSGVTLVNNGTINNQGEIVNKGIIENQGDLYNRGAISSHAHGIIGSGRILDNRIDFEPIDYFFSNGTGSYAKGSGVNLGLTIQMDYVMFTDVLMDGALLTRDAQYSAKDGSTFITLFASYLDSLPVGQHRLKVRFSNSFDLETVITVTGVESITETDSNIPLTGFDDGLEVWLIILGVSILGMFSLVLLLRRYKRR